MINHKKVHRIYKEELLFIRTKKSRHRKVSTELRTPPPVPSSLNQVWTMDFFHGQLVDGRKIRMLTLVYKFSREALKIEVGYRLLSINVLQTLEELKRERGVPEIICVDNGSEFTLKILDECACENGVKLHFIKPGKPTENGHIESFNGKLRDECLNINFFQTLESTQEIKEKWRIDNNEWRRPISIRNLTSRESARRKTLQRIA